MIHTAYGAEEQWAYFVYFAARFNHVAHYVFKK